MTTKPLTTFGLRDVDHKGTRCGGWTKVKDGVKYLTIWTNYDDGSFRTQCTVVLSEFNEYLRSEE